MQWSVVLDSLHRIHVQIMTNVIILVIHEICMHRTIHKIKLLNCGVVSPSHVLKTMIDDSFGPIINDVLLWEIVKNKHSCCTTFTIPSTTWCEVRHDRVESDYF